MNNKRLILSIFCILLFFTAISISFTHRNIVENDEGIYWTTFLMADKGYSLYKEISFSQLPGFFISIFAIFKIFGSSIAAARLGVIYWTLLALIAIVWLGYKRKNLLFSLFSLLLLICIPTFFNQSITFQSDMVAVAFSTLSIVFLTIFSSENRKNKMLLIIAALFFSLALLTKLDYSLVLPFAFILLTEKKNKAASIFLFTLVAASVILLSLNFFGINSVINTVLALREKAASLYSFDPTGTIRLLLSDRLLALLIFINIPFAVFPKQKDKFWVSLLLWFLSSLLLYFSFRPVFHHHLVFVTVPSVLFFANNILSLNTSIKRLIQVGCLILIFISMVSFMDNYAGLKSRQRSRLIKDREIAKNFILKYSNPSDFIITDEAALYGITGRMPPPELVDLSEVQIESGNISGEKFRKALQDYKPELIMVWNGRLNPAKWQAEPLNDYVVIELIDGRKLFIRE